MISDETVRQAIEFGRTVTEIREKAGLTLDEAATLLNCSSSALAHVETHGLEPTVMRYLQVLVAMDPEGPFLSAAFA